MDERSNQRPAVIRPGDGVQREWRYVRQREYPNVCGHLVALCIQEDRRALSPGLVANWRFCHRWNATAPGLVPTEGPQPEPWSHAAAKASGALVFASFAVQLGEGAPREALVQGAVKLAEVAVTQF